MLNEQLSPCTQRESLLDFVSSSSRLIYLMQIKSTWLYESMLLYIAKRFVNCSQMSPALSHLYQPSLMQLIISRIYPNVSTRTCQRAKIFNNLAKLAAVSYFFAKCCPNELCIKFLKSRSIFYCHHINYKAESPHLKTTIRVEISSFKRFLLNSTLHGIGLHNP